MSIRFPLATTTWGQEEQDAMQRVIASGMFTMGRNVQEFENDFAKVELSSAASLSEEVRTCADLSFIASKSLQSCGFDSR